MSSKRKKNTYVIDIKPGHYPQLPADILETPLPIVTLNGRKVESSMKYIENICFAAEPARIMIQEHKDLYPVMGEMANTIIEYLDKDDCAFPVVRVFPQTVQFFDSYTPENYLQHLNHASRQDIKYRMKQRCTFLSMMEQKQK